MSSREDYRHAVARGDVEGAAERARAARRWRLALSSIAGALGTVVAVALSVLALAWCGSVAAPSAPRRWTFLEEAPDPTALGFSIPTDRAGAWVLADEAHATGARALINLAGVPGEHPATAVVEDPSPRDVRLHTRCKVSPERPHQACGVVFRYRDARSYYVARVDAVSGAVTLAVLLDGDERVLQSVEARVEPATWQELLVEARSDHLDVTWNGRRVIRARDRTLARSGAVGLWAPADCVAYFDELSVQPITPGGGSSQSLPFLL